MKISEVPSAGVACAYRNLRLALSELNGGSIDSFRLTRDGRLSCMCEVALTRAQLIIVLGRSSIGISRTAEILRHLPSGVICVRLWSLSQTFRFFSTCQRGLSSYLGQRRTLQVPDTIHCGIGCRLPLRPLTTAKPRRLNPDRVHHSEALLDDPED